MGVGDTSGGSPRSEQRLVWGQTPPEDEASPQARGGDGVLPQTSGDGGLLEKMDRGAHRVWEEPVGL